MISEQQNGRAWTRLIRLRIGVSGEGWGVGRWVAVNVDVSGSIKCWHYLTD